MTAEPFSYEQYETTRQELIKAVQQTLNNQDKQFLLSFSNGEPEWGIYDFERFPSIQWKLQNLRKLKADSPEKHKEQYHALITLMS